MATKKTINVANQSAGGLVGQATRRASPPWEALEDDDDVMRAGACLLDKAGTKIGKPANSRWRDTLLRITMLPRLSAPMRWKVLLATSRPMVVTGSEFAGVPRELR